MQPLRIVPRFVQDLAPLTTKRNILRFDRIALGRGLYDILAVEGAPISTSDDNGISPVTWRGCMSDIYWAYALKNGGLVREMFMFNIPDDDDGEATHHDTLDIHMDDLDACRKRRGEAKGMERDRRVAFTGSVIAGAHPNEDDLFPGRLFFELGYPRRCVELRFENGRILSNEPCHPVRVYELRQWKMPTDDPDLADESMAAIFAMKLPAEWPFSCNCPLPVIGADAIGGGYFDLLLSMLLRILRNRERDTHPFRLFSRLLRGLREGPTSSVALDPWAPWHQKLHEIYHGCACLPDLERALRIEATSSYKEVGSCPIWRP